MTSSSAPASKAGTQAQGGARGAGGGDPQGWRMRTPWWGYKRIAVVAWPLGVSNKQVCKVVKAVRLFELLPKGPNELWQSDVTYIHIHIHIPGHGWWYAVTVIDYYSSYLLACPASPGEARESLEVLRRRYNDIRPPWALIPPEGGDPTRLYGEPL